MFSLKTFVTALAIPVASSLPLLSTRASDGVAFNTSQPFTLHTEVIKGDKSFDGFYLTAFHVGAGQQTIVGTKNSSLSIGWVLGDSSLQQPLSSGSSNNLPPYNLTLLDQAPYRSDAPAGYDYISMSYSASTPGFHLSSANASTNSTGPIVQYAGDSSAIAFGGWALCHVNGTSPYFTLGPQYQLLWKTSNATTCYQSCADVNLVASNI